MRVGGGDDRTGEGVRGGGGEGGNRTVLLTIAPRHFKRVTHTN